MSMMMAIASIDIRYRFVDLYHFDCAALDNVWDAIGAELAAPVSSGHLTSFHSD